MQCYFLPPDWRHIHCCELISEPETSPEFAIDSVVSSYLALLRSQSNTTSAVSTSQSMQGNAFWKTLHLVYRIRHEDQCRYIRDELQIRVLAGQQRGAIAKATGLSRTEITIYEYLYIAIRHKLNLPEYIHYVVFSGSAKEELECAFPASVKMLAYLCGVPIVDNVLLLGRLLRPDSMNQIGIYSKLLCDVLQRTELSELRAFLATNSRQGLYREVIQLLAGLLGQSSVDEILESISRSKATAVNSIVKKCASIELAQLCMLNVA